MASMNSILIIDLDSELSSILSSYCSLIGTKVQFTTRVMPALRKIENQRFSHIFIEANLQIDEPLFVIEALSTKSGINFKTPLTLMVEDQGYQLPTSAASRLSSILLKPFSLDQFVFHLNQVPSGDVGTSGALL